jgi:hypothetical protein
LSGEDLDSSNGAHEFGSNSGRTFVTGQPHDQHATLYRTWCRAALETVGTFFVLAGIAVGILTLRLALVLVHGVMH